MISLEGRLEKIQNGADEILRNTESTISDGDKVYYSTFVIIGAVKRSLSLSSAFCSMVRAKNFVAAAPLVRLQLDTLLRLNAACLYEGGMEEFAKKLLSGEPTNKLRSHDKEKMTDSYLVRKVSEEYPWVQNVYKELCDLVHFSDRHIFAALTAKDEKDRTFRVVVSAEDLPRPDEDYFEMVDCFRATLQATGRYVVGWASAIKRAA